MLARSRRCVYLELKTIACLEAIEKDLAALGDVRRLEEGDYKEQAQLLRMFVQEERLGKQWFTYDKRVRSMALEHGMFQPLARMFSRVRVQNMEGMAGCDCVETASRQVEILRKTNSMNPNGKTGFIYQLNQQANNITVT